MNSEYALLINGTLSEIRWYSERPDDIPHKGVQWLPVKRITGTEEYSGVGDDQWIICTIDPATLPPAVPESITRRQCALQLWDMNFISVDEAIAMAKTADMPTIIYELLSKELDAQSFVRAQIDFAAANYYRSNSLLPMLGMKEEEIDQFFIAAAQH